MIRAVALQASSDLDENSAAHIVNFMSSMAIALPCPECRAHFVEDWLDSPYTMAHATNTAASIDWVEQLSHKVDMRVAAKRRELGLPVLDGAGAGVGAGAGAGAVTGVGVGVGASSAAGFTPAIAARSFSTGPILSRPAAARRARAVMGGGGGGTGAAGAASAVARSMGVTGPVGDGASRALQQYAVKAAMHVTRANQSGRRMGCNCASHK